MSGRCPSCDVILEPHEMYRESLYSNEHFDMCDRCMEQLLDDNNVQENDGISGETEINQQDGDDN